MREVVDNVTPNKAFRVSKNAFAILQEVCEGVMIERLSLGNTLAIELGGKRALTTKAFQVANTILDPEKQFLFNGTTRASDLLGKHEVAFPTGKIADTTLVLHPKKASGSGDKPKPGSKDKATNDASAEDEEEEQVSEPIKEKEEDKEAAGTDADAVVSKEKAPKSD